MAKIIPVASGKGGVGKTFFVTNLSILLAQKGQRVVAVDLDLGGSNLHTMLGIKNDLYGIGHYIYDKTLPFDKIIHRTEFDNLKFIPGDALFVGAANIPYFRKKKILSEISKIDADWVILDLGSGSTLNTIDFFLASNCGILVTTPELTAVLNLYSFLKNSFYRYIFNGLKKNAEVRDRLVEAVKTRLEKENTTFCELLKIIKKDFPEEEKRIDDLVNNFFPKLLLNMGNNERDIAFGENLRKIIKKNMGLEVEYLGLLPEEHQARRYVIARKPLSVVENESKWVEGCSKIADRLLEFHDYPVTIFEDDVDSLDVVYDDMRFVIE
ncbi:MAG TPA: P-loop NTPase [Spirochaetota bacterium]|jgi:flagellar biosynthesis protein FlhG|nr:MAG: Flagellum site-determining protein YlxH [Spirochaetes bacterium ADurb.Bin133]HPY88074.1 P-loop NTPase [Spirochaetota bacterium]HQB62142.1 P-loop NTPase [Spirochaetota bacterium]